MDKARIQLHREYDIVKIIQSRRFFQMAFKRLLRPKDLEELQTRSKFHEIKLDSKRDGKSRKRNRVTTQPTTTDVNEISATDLSRSQLPSQTDDFATEVDQIVELQSMQENAQVFQDGQRQRVDKYRAQR